MKKTLSISFIIILLCGFDPYSIKAQISMINQEVSPGMHASYTDFTAAPLTFKRGSVFFTQADGSVGSSQDVILQRAEKDDLGFEHLRYIQTHKGISIQHGVYIIHQKDNKVVSANGDLIKDFPANLPTAPSISEAEALKIALQKIGARKYMWEEAASEKHLKEEQNDPTATYQPKGKLVYYSGKQGIVPSKLRLAYVFDIYAQEPKSRQNIYVDAITGRVMDTENKIQFACHAKSHSTKETCIENKEKYNTITSKPLLNQIGDNVAQAMTAYSGLQTITTNNVILYNQLSETKRGKGIKTLNMKNAGEAYAKATQFIDSDNYWNNINSNLDQYATDAHWGAEKTHDYYKFKHGRNGIDNEGFVLNNYIHYKTPIILKAFWDGYRMTYGDGGIDEENNVVTPLTALDIIGHEITHGLTEKTSGLLYYYESGALNEGFSDIFGTCIEFYAKQQKANWLIGEDIGVVIRDMAHPNDFENPHTYNGKYWDPGIWLTMHTNSGVLNYWFYLLVNGGSGTNDLGVKYNVPAIGMDKAAKIAFRTNTYYLKPTSVYFEARNLSILAAEDLYGVNSPEALATKLAWLAVGIGDTQPSPVCTDIYGISLDNNKITTADDISLNLELTAKIPYYSEPDYYTFYTTNAQPKLKIELYDLPVNYNLYLYEGNKKIIKYSSNSGTMNELIVHNPNVGMKYYIAVLPSGQAQSDKCYRFKVSTSASNFPENKVINEGKLENIEVASLVVYPNPLLSNTFNLQFDKTYKGSEQLIITNMVGDAKFSKQVNFNQGKNTLNVELPNNLRNGIYLLRLGDLKTTISIQR